jgi:hypothetical protein
LYAAEASFLPSDEKEELIEMLKKEYGLINHTALDTTNN